MKLNDIFLPHELKQAKKELDCYGYCLDNAIAHYLHGNFKKASGYHENAARSLRELQAMKDKKKLRDQEKDVLLQIELKGDIEQIEKKMKRLGYRI